MTWAWILMASSACYTMKLAGQLVPSRVFSNERVEQLLGLVPIALLGALIASQVLVSGHRWTVDARLPAIIVAAGLVALRAPFLVVVVGAALTAALVRMIS